MVIKKTKVEGEGEGRRVQSFAGFGHFFKSVVITIEKDMKINSGGQGTL